MEDRHPERWGECKGVTGRSTGGQSLLYNWSCDSSPCPRGPFLRYVSIHGISDFTSSYSRSDDH